MHFQSSLVAIVALGASVLSSPLQERNSWPWISNFDNTNMACTNPPAADAPWLKLKEENHCYGFAPATNNVGWSWGAGLGMSISRIKLFSDANCQTALIWADVSNDTSSNGYCLTTKQWQPDYPQWNPSNAPILSVMASSET